jgi:hypothetical protein
VAADAKDTSELDETAVWQRLRREKLTIRNRWWRRRNRLPDTDSTSAQTTLDQQFFNVTERQGISKIPTDCAKDDFGFAVPPFEDCWAFSY